MKPFPLPVTTTGPGSQPAEDDAPGFATMPREMHTFSMPEVPGDADARDVRAARDLLSRFLRSFRASAAAPANRVDLAGMPAPVVRVLNETLGEGEVSIRIGGAGAIRVQESVFAGVWRERHHDERGELVRDWLQGCAIPPVAIDAARDAAAETLAMPDFPPGAMNSPALLHEIRERVRGFSPGAAPHIVNLTLLPLTAEDLLCLGKALPPGPVAILSRGFGNCRVTSTTVRNVWRVQYFNSMQTLILDTLEVADVPEVARAAEEDLEDSRQRLAELLDWMERSD